MPQEPKQPNMCRRKNIYSNGVMRYRQRDEITEWIPDIDSVRQFRRTNRPGYQQDATLCHKCDRQAL